MPEQKLLIIEDTDDIHTLAKEFLKDSYEIVKANNGRQGLEIARSLPISLILLDKNFTEIYEKSELLNPNGDPRDEGIFILNVLKKEIPHIPIIMITNYHDIPTSQKVTEFYGCDFLAFEEVVNDSELLSNTILRLLSTPQMRKSLINKYTTLGLFGKSELMLKVFENIEHFAKISETTILILGEPGVGKELAAKAIHIESSNSRGPFVAVNCAAIPSGLLESELFGYERGAFADAKTMKPGLVEKADGGTLFLDEIGEMEIGLQGKLLRFLQFKEFYRVGGTKQMRVNLRIITATNKDLEACVGSGSFRLDLYNRIKQGVIEIAPLRKRKHDIPVLVEYFLDTMIKKYLITPLKVSKALVQFLQSYEYPGNVRELEFMIKNAAWQAIAKKQKIITLSCISLSLRNQYEPALPCCHKDFDGACRLLCGSSLNQIERQAFLQTYKKHNGNVIAVCNSLKISKSKFYEIRNKYLETVHLKDSSDHLNLNKL